MSLIDYKSGATWRIPVRIAHRGSAKNAERIEGWIDHEVHEGDEDWKSLEQSMGLRALRELRGENGSAIRLNADF